jgi:hypothetical protein
VCLRLADTQAGRVAVELLREDMIDAVFWGSKPTLDCGKGVGPAYRRDARAHRHGRRPAKLNAEPEGGAGWQVPHYAESGG